MHRKSGFMENFEFIKCTILWKFSGKIVYFKCTKNSNLFNVQYYEKLMENCIHYMYRKSRFMEIFEFVGCTKSSKFNRKLSTLDLQIVLIREKNFNSLNVWYHENSIKIYV